MSRQRTYHTEIPMEGGVIRARLEQSLLNRWHCWWEGRHKTSGFELHILIKNTAAVRIKEKELILRQGDAILIAPDVPHSADSGEGNPIRRFFVHFSVEGEKLQEQLRQEVGDSRVIHVGQALTGLAGEIIDEIATEEAYQTECIQHMVSLLFLRVFRAAGICSGKPVAYDYSDNELERCNIIDGFFRFNLDMKNGEAELAARLGLSVRQLIRVLQKNYGMTYREMLIKKRVELAADLLRTTDHSVRKVAETVGYASETAFTQAFRSIYGMPPGAYRKQAAEKP